MLYFSCVLHRSARMNFFSHQILLSFAVFASFFIFNELLQVETLIRFLQNIRSSSHTSAALQLSCILINLPIEHLSLALPSSLRVTSGKRGYQTSLTFSYYAFRKVNERSGKKLATSVCKLSDGLNCFARTRKFNLSASYSL